MRFTTIKLTRDELYQKVWERPVSAVAKEYGISDVSLAKMCRRLNVPIPARGYWAKVRHGQRAEPSPLPPAPEDTRLEVAISPGRKVATDPEQFSAAEIIDAEQLKAFEVRVSETLCDPHPAVTHTLKVMGRAKPGEDGLVRVEDAACLPVTVSRAQLHRALRIMDSLLKAFAARGYAVKIGGDDQPELSVAVADDPVSFYLCESTVGVPMTGRRLKEAEASGLGPWLQYDYSPSGSLALKVTTNLRNGLRRQWSDSAKRPLERSLNSFLAGVVKLAAAVRATRLERERRRQKREDREQRRLDLIRAQEREKHQLEQLDHRVLTWHKARQIREYVEAVRAKALREHGRIEPGSETERWIAWAMVQADRYDPLVAGPPSVLDEPAP